MAKRRPVWDGERVRALREHLGMTQQELAEELNMRQQTVSEWETGQYRPRGASERLLTLVAERATFTYDQPDDG
jgi:DNA-binding transcriptional regulator YiaG